MKRRNFLKTCLLTLVTAYAPLSLKDEEELVTLTRTWFKPGIWAGMEGAAIEILESDGLIVRNLEGFKVKEVDFENQTVWFEAT